MLDPTDSNTSTITTLAEETPDFEIDDLIETRRILLIRMHVSGRSSLGTQDSIPLGRHSSPQSQR